MTDQPDTLWPGATPLMRLLSAAGAARRPISPDALAALWNPATCPSVALPYLASAVGVAVWDATWDDTKKRSVISSTIRLRRKLGTVPAFETILGFIGAEVVQAKAPPQICVPAASITPAQRAAWAAQFPEVRVYLYAEQHVRTGVIVCGKPVGGSRKFLTKSVAPEFAGNRATIVENGAETPVTISNVQESDGSTYHQVSLPTTGARFRAGSILGTRDSTPVASTAADRLYSYSTGGSMAPDTLPPRGTPLDITPTLVAQQTVRRGVLSPGKPWFGSAKIAVESTADQRVYTSLRLFVPSLAAAGKVGPRGGWILGSSQLGMSPFTMSLAVDLSYQRPGRRLFPSLPGVVRPHDPSRVTEAIAAIRAAKLGRDKVTLRTGLYRPINTGDGVSLSGGFKLGQVIRSLQA